MTVNTFTAKLTNQFQYHGLTDILHLTLIKLHIS